MIINAIITYRKCNLNLGLELVVAGVHRLLIGMADQRGEEEEFREPSLLALHSRNQREPISCANGL